MRVLHLTRSGTGALELAKWDKFPPKPQKIDAKLPIFECRFRCLTEPTDYYPPVKSSAVRILLIFFLLPPCAFAANSVVNMSHYDLMRPDFVGMANEGIVGVIHEATFPRLQRDARYYERQQAALDAGLLWGAYHFGDATNPIGQADHFMNSVASARSSIRPDESGKRWGVLLVLDFEKNNHYPGGTMSVAQAVA